MSCRCRPTSGQVTLERHEAQGLVAGLNNGVTSVEADEANRIRDCLLPYRDRIMETLLEPANAVPDLPSTTYIPPPDWPSLLAPPYRTDYANEADNFGVVPTIGLNPNVNNYTPDYINGGAVITTGELEHAMQTRMQFYLVDVLEGSHTPLPGAYRVPGGGMVDYQNDVAKQAWFINQLLGITGGPYDAPIVIYCAGVNCWELFNAATRAIVAGLSNIYWYRGGLGAWQASLGSQPPAQPAASRPGWCVNARKQSESTICANGALWALDAQLGAASRIASTGRHMRCGSSCSARSSGGLARGTIAAPTPNACKMLTSAASISSRPNEAGCRSVARKSALGQYSETRRRMRCEASGKARRRG